MSHYEKRLEEDLTRIRDRVVAVATRVADAVERSVDGLLRGDTRIANETMLGDLPINRDIRDIDRECHAFVARHLPSAGHLRFVSSVLRLDVAIERIGDYAVTIGRETNQLLGQPPAEMARDVELMAEHAVRMLRETIKAFEEGNAELAREAKAMAAQGDNLFGRVYLDLLHAGDVGTRPVKDLFALLTVFNALERVTDQAKNICEETIFAVTGETKVPKTYRVLFADTRNDGASQLAEAFARKAFPSSGVYASAGWEPATKLTEACRSFLDSHGYDVAEARPKPIDRVPNELSSYNVIVSLEGDPRPHFPQLHFRTILLQWDLAATASDPGLDETFKEISLRVRDLMETLRGADAG